MKIVSGVLIIKNIGVVQYELKNAYHFYFGYSNSYKTLFERINYEIHDIIFLSIVRNTNKF